MAKTYYADRPESFRWKEVDGGIEITDYLGVIQLLEIPSEIGGKPVVSLGGKHGFCGRVRQILVPATVKQITAGAFEDVYGERAGLHSLELVENHPYLQKKDNLLLSRDGTRLFLGFGEADTVKIPEGVRVIASKAFSMMHHLRGVTLPSTLEVLEEGAFAGCRGVDLNLPEGMKRLGYAVLGKDSFGWGQSKISIPSTLEELGNTPYANLVNVERNPRFRVIKSGKTQIAILSADGKQLIAVDKEVQELEVPEGVEEIMPYAFCRCSSLKKLTLPTTLRSIGHHAFCANKLKTLRLPASLEIWEEDAYDVAGLNSILLDKKNPWFYTDKICLFRKLANENMELITCFRPKLEDYQVPEGVVSIREGAFSNCNQLNRLVLPESLEQYNQANLVGFQPETGKLSKVRKLTLSNRAKDTLTIEDNEIFFTQDHILYERTPEGLVVRQCVGTYDHLTIKEGTVRIAADAFSGKVASIQLPNSLRVIEDGAFVHLGLQEITLPEGLEFMGKEAFSANEIRTVTLPASLRWMPTDAFHVCPIEAYQVAEGSPYYRSQDGVLYSADGTTLYRVPVKKACDEFVVPEGVTEISAAFYGCEAIKTIRLPDSLEKLWARAFVGCGKLKHLYLGKGLQYIHDSFIDFDYAVTIHIDPGSPMIDLYQEFCKNQYLQVKLKLAINGMEKIAKLSKEFVLLPNNTGLAIIKYQGKNPDVVIPEALGDHPITAIGSGAFANTNITAITIPDTVTEMENSAFHSCRSLKTVTLSAGLKKLPPNLFNACSALTEIVVPEGVEEIGYGAFFGCSKLTKYVLPASLRWISPNVFADDDSGRYRDLYYNFDSVYQVVPGSYAEQFLKAYEVNSYRGKTLKVVYGENVPLSGDAKVLEYLDTTPLEDGTLSVSFKRDFPEHVTEVEIPETIDGKAVSAIVSAGRYIPSPITRLSIPASVTQISLVHNSNVADFPDYARYMEKFEVAAENPVFWTDGHALYSKDRTRLIHMMNYATTAYTVLPETKVIGEEAFERMARLQTLVLPEGLQEIGANAFHYCKALEEIEGITSVPGVTTRLVQNTPWYEKQKVLYFGTTLVRYTQTEETTFTIREGTTAIAPHAFERYNYWNNTAGDNLEEIIIPDSVTTIGENAFIHRDKLKALNLPPKLDAIAPFLLTNCRFIQTLHIPATVQTIDPRGLPNHSYGWQGRGTCAFAAVDVAADNPNYKSVDGVLYTKDGGTLIRVPPCHPQTEFTVPPGVHTIGAYAFHSCWDLESVHLPDSVETIKAHAFVSCEKLAHVRLGAVKTIKESAFEGCKALKNICLPDTLEVMGARVFYGCGLTRITLPKSIKTVGQGAFFGCEEVEFYDTIDPDIKALGDKRSWKEPIGSPGEMASRISDRGIWNNHTLILRSAETGEIKYRMAMNGHDQPNVYTSAMTQGWYRNGAFDFASLDNVFGEMKGTPNKITTAVHRLRWPVHLSDEDKDIYIRYLVRSAKDLVKGCVDRGDMDTLTFCAPLGVLKKNNMDELIEYAANAKAAECSAYLMGYKMEHFAPKKGGAALSLSLKTAPQWTAPKTGTRKIGRYKGSDTVVEFPTEWNGTPLTGIAATTTRVPDNYKAITAVVIPEGYTSIGDNAFCHCDNLESVTLPSTLESIGRYAFGNCPKLKEIILPDSVTSLDKECFMSCTGLETIGLSENLTTIPGSAFHGCAALKEVHLPARVRFIGKDAFVDTPSLTKFIIRGKQLSSEGQIFWQTPPVYCYPGTKIEVFGIGKKHIHYMTEDGIEAPASVVYTELEELVFKDKIFVLSGFDEWTAAALTDTITAKGGVVKNSVVVKTDYLIINENYGGITSKYEKAMELNTAKGKNIAILSHAKFNELSK